MKRLLLLIPVLLGLASCEKPAPPPKAAVFQPTIDSKIDVPTHGAYTGAYIDFGDSEDDVTLETIDNFETAVKKHQAIIASSSYWGQQSFPRRNLDIIARHNSIPLVYWSPWDKPYEQDRGPDRFSLTNILAGQWDAYIDSWADQAKAFGRPMFVAWGLEMNGTWFPWSGAFYGGGKPLSPGVYAGPEYYKKAYRYVVDRVRARGAKNIVWVFHMNNYSYPLDAWNVLKSYYPGDDYVDWLGISAYGKQFVHDPWISAKDSFTYAYDDLCALSPNKPVMFAEWGIAEFPAVGSKSEWITEAFDLMTNRLPRLKAAVFWNERWENEDGSYSNLRATSSPKSLAAYIKGVSNPYWLSEPKYK